MRGLLSFKKLFRSFGYAARGLKAAFKTEQNFRVHTIAALLAILLACLFRVTGYEWALIVLCIIAVTGAELINTAIERICDLVQPEKDARVQYIKDVSAAAVLLVAAGALIIGLLIFIPRLMTLI
ncbi:diacylglycerol kinase family protein [Niabella sp.]|uniref:diacylglycerol kinase n=1 Tax=Niabella sp. TaxID=1962976 RepID=UPI00262199D1|nr:diacylglycerol kinase family protein [Niabella sp.]